MHAITCLCHAYTAAIADNRHYHKRHTYIIQCFMRLYKWERTNPIRRKFHKGYELLMKFLCFEKFARTAAWMCRVHHTKHGYHVLGSAEASNQCRPLTTYIRIIQLEALNGRTFARKSHSFVYG